MKISIWRQFSSNHSANFTIVAEFPSEDEAFNQYMIIRRALRNMIHKLEKLTDDDRYGSLSSSDFLQFPGQIETELVKTFNIKPHYESDWLYLLNDDWLPFVFKQFDNYISFIPLGNTWTAAEPLDRVLEAVGGRVYRSGEQYDYDFGCTVICHALTEELAIEIENQLIQSQEWRDQFKKPIPWLSYFNGRKHHKADELAQLEQTIFERNRVIREWEEATRKKTEQLQQRYKDESNDGLRSKYFWEYANYIREQRRQRPTFSDLKFEGIPFGAIYSDLPYKGKISRHGTTIELDTNYLWRELPSSVPAIVAWMRDLGCEVKIEFTEKEG